jgi:hypothetical protein
MYQSTVLNKNAHLNPLSEDTRKLDLLNKAKSILRSNSRQLTKAEKRAQSELFMSKLQESNQTIGLQSFQGFTGGHILHRKK